MARNFKPLAISLIDEGEFEKNVNNDLRDIQEKMVEFVKTHGQQAHKAKAVLTIKIALVCDAPDDELFSVKASTKIEVPGRPPSVTMAMAEHDDEDRPALFVRNSGSSKSHPKQGALTTKTGQPIDLETGEVKE